MGWLVGWLVDLFVLVWFIVFGRMPVKMIVVLIELTLNYLMVSLLPPLQRSTPLKFFPFRYTTLPILIAVI